MQNIYMYIPIGGANCPRDSAPMMTQKNTEIIVPPVRQFCEQPVYTSI
jgi:hypothetical protein